MKNKIALFDIDYTLFNTELFKQSNLKMYVLYDEVQDVLLKLQKKISLGILSEGEDNLQRKKLHKTNIYSIFNEKNIHILENKDQALNQTLKEYNGKKIYIVDDKLNFLNKVKEQFPLVFTIWIKRGIYAENQKPIKGFKPDKIVQDLKELVNLL